MTDHADTIHRMLTRLSVAYPGPEDANKAHAALDALLAERDRYRKVILDYVDAYEGGETVLAGTIYERLYEIATEGEE